MSGMGTSQTTQNQSGTSQTSPWAPTVPTLQNEINNINGLTGYGHVTPASQALWGKAGQTAAGLPNPGTAAAGVGQNILSTGGDPTGILSKMQQSMGNINDPASSPGMQGLLNTINTQTRDAVNPMFAGAGRSLSGDNMGALGREITKAEAPILQGQYNANLGTLGNIASARTGNQQTGIQDLSAALPLSQLPAQTQQTAMNAPATNAGQLAGLAENLTIPISGLGGNTSFAGQGTGTQTASPLSQLMQIAGLFGRNGFGGMLGGGILGGMGTV